MTSPNSYPEGKELEKQINGRHQRGLFWRVLFQASTIVGILTLVALLYNVTNQAFGLVAVQNVATPDSLVLGLQEERMLAASHVISSEDDGVLAAGVASEANAVGFFGYAYYQENSDSLKAVSVEGVAPSAETVENGEYPLSRPLFIYTTAEIMAEKPEVAAFVNYYLQYLNDEIIDVGYFPPGSSEQTENIAAWLINNGANTDTLPAIDPDAVDGNVIMAGSSTVFPLTRRMMERFQADGYSGLVTIDNIGTTAGMQRFCVDGDIDIANASRAITPAELDACKAIGRTPIEFRVGTDAVVVVVNQQNSFLSNVTLEQLRPLFTTAVGWSEINNTWPAEPILRYVPGADSGTLDFFAETVYAQDLVDLPKEDLVQILAANISVGLGRRLERDQLFFSDRLIFESLDVFTELCASAEPAAACSLPARDQQNVYALVVERVVQPEIKQTWSLVDSIFRRNLINQEMQQEYPNAELEFRSWITPTFVTSPQNPSAPLAGVRTAILGSLWVILITVLFAFPVGVGAAIYLEEYAHDTFLNRLIKTNINNLAGVPSIIYGMLGLAIFVRVLETFTSGAFLGAVEDGTTANGRTILSAGLTLGLLILPVIIINAQEAIRTVPLSLRQASFGLGATKWQTIWHHVLPSAIPGILTGTILAMSRAIGETAPLVVVGASTFITVDPDGPFAKFTTLPIQIYQWTSRPQPEFRNIAAAAIIVLLILLLSLNATAVILRNRYTKKA